MTLVIGERVVRSLVSIVVRLEEALESVNESGRLSASSVRVYESERYPRTYIREL